jgi:hypothetical protein
MKKEPILRQHSAQQQPFAPSHGGSASAGECARTTALAGHHAGQHHPPHAGGAHGGGDASFTVAAAFWPYGDTLTVFDVPSAVLGGGVRFDGGAVYAHARVGAGDISHEARRGAGGADDDDDDDDDDGDEFGAHELLGADVDAAAIELDVANLAAAAAELNAAEAAAIAREREAGGYGGLRGPDGLSPRLERGTHGDASAYCPPPWMTIGFASTLGSAMAQQQWAVPQ